MAHQRSPRPTNGSRHRVTGVRPWLAAPVLLAGLMATPAQAGSVTAESIWDRSNAIQRAQSQLPAGATVTRSECTVVNVRTGNYRYICTVFYADPPATAAPAAPNPNAPSAPAP
ncbi:MAG: hypothetical protein ACKO5M_02670 [Vulcanococcus sp.]